MANKQEKMTLEKLAIMINNGFEDVKKELRGEIQNVKKELKEEIQEFRQENQKEHGEITREQEDLKLRQDSVAYRFELVALSGRVEKLEKITEINSAS